MKFIIHRSPCLLNTVIAFLMGFWLDGRQVTAGESKPIPVPKERWTYTANSHFSLYGLLALSPIYRDQIRSTLLDREHVYSAIVTGRSGLLFPQAAEVIFLAQDRYQGGHVWERRFPFKGYPIATGLVSVSGRIVAALFEEETKNIVMLGIDPTDGKTSWQVSIQGARGPTLVGDEVVLDIDSSREAVIVNVMGNKQRRQVTLNVRDGSRISESSYPGYFWRSGTRRTRGFVFGYDGIPTGLSLRKYERLLAFHEGSGKLAWTLPLSPRGSSPPVRVNDSLLISSGDQLIKLDLRTGKPHWNVGLGGYRPGDPDPPLLIGSRIAVAYTATLDPEDKQWKLSFRRLSDGKEEGQVQLYQGESETFAVLRRAGDLVIVGSYFLIQVVDVRAPTMVATLNFEKLLSRFVYSDPPSMRLDDSDDKGFIVTTSDGKLRYFAAEDFRDISSSQVSPIEGEPSGFNFLPILFYLVVNPLWDMVLPNRTTFLVFFYGFPLVPIGLVLVWRPLWVLLQRKGVGGGARWGAWIGLLLSLPAAIYRGLLGGIAAAFGLYGSFGPIWGGFVGFSIFMVVGLLLGIAIGSFCSLVWLRKGRYGSNLQ